MWAFADFSEGLEQRWVFGEVAIGPELKQKGGAWRQACVALESRLPSDLDYAVGMVKLWLW